MIPDNSDIFDYYEREMERWDRLYRRMEIEEEKEDTAYRIEESEDERWQNFLETTKASDI